MLLAAGVLMFSACDRFLDIRPVGKVIPETPAEYRALMTTAYQFQFIDRSLTDMRTDGLVVRSDELDQNNYGDIEKWIDVNYGAATQPFGWAKYYESVYYANAIIDGQSRMKEGNGEEMLQLAGEAYLMRGYLHFLLANLYGQPYTVSGAPQTKAVPVKLDLDLESVLGRSTLAHVYESVLADIEKARTLITKQTWDSAHMYRFSTLSVDALDSRIHLYMGAKSIRCGRACTAEETGA